MSERPRRSLGRLLRRPSVQTDALQVLKAVVAGTTAWALADGVLGLASPYLAPWTALLAVHATIYSSVRRGAQAVLATLIGIVLAFASASLLGGGILTLALVLLLGLAVARAPGLRTEGVAVATTALFVLTGGMADDVGLLGERFVATAVGVLVALVVNVALVPPVTDRSAEIALDEVDRRLGELLSRMAEELRGPEVSSDLSEGWTRRTREIDRHLVEARGWAHRAVESHWWNPRRRLGRQQLSDPDLVEDVVQRLEVGVSSVRGMARAIHESTASSDAWDDDFRERWTDILGRAGQRVAHPDADVSSLREDLAELTRSLGRDGLEDKLWPLYGRLISELGDVVRIVDDVASSRRVREPTSGDG